MQASNQKPNMPKRIGTDRLPWHSSSSSSCLLFPSMSMSTPRRLGSLHSTVHLASARIAFCIGLSIFSICVFSRSLLFYPPSHCSMRSVSIALSVPLFISLSFSFAFTAYCTVLLSFVAFSACLSQLVSLLCLPWPLPCSSLANPFRLRSFPAFPYSSPFRTQILFATRISAAVLLVHSCWSCLCNLNLSVWLTRGPRMTLCIQ